MINSRFLFFSLAFLTSQFSFGFCTEYYIRREPITIEILPYVDESSRHSSLAGALTEESNPIENSAVNADEKYSHEYGLGMTFKYTSLDEFPNDLNEKPLLEKMQQYRQDYLGKSNPLIVKFIVTFTQKTDSGEDIEKQITVPSGMFVSGMDNDYRLSRNGKGLISKDEFFYSTSLHLMPQFKGCVFDKVEDKNSDERLACASKEFKKANNFIKENIKKITSTNVSIVKKFQPKIDELQKIMREELSQFEKQLLDDNEFGYVYHHLSHEGVYVLPPIVSKCFPVTLKTIYNLTGIELQEIHFKNIVKRIFGYNLLRNDDRKKTTIFDESLFLQFKHHLSNDHGKYQSINKLFDKELLDNGDTPGCFHSDFDFWFSDSEQVFIAWLDKINLEMSNLDFRDFTYERMDLSGFNEYSRITKLDVQFISYLDMCPACRGTISLLMEKKNGQPSWIEQKVNKLISALICKNKNDGYSYPNIWSELTTMRFFCTSKAKCGKGDKK